MLKHAQGVSRRNIIRTAAALGVLGAGGTGAVAGDDTVETNVGYSRPSGRRAARDEAKSVEREFNFDALTIRTSREGAERLRNRGDIRYVEENGEMYALAQILPWGIDRVDAEVAHDEGETGSGADIAILDTGIDSDHYDLAANIEGGKCFTDDCCGEIRGACGFGIKPNDNVCHHPWDDDHDHGTHCAGIADAIDNTDGVKGVSTEATLYAGKVLDGCGSGSWDSVAAGIEWAADQGHDVASMSLGGDTASDVVRDACTYAYDNGVLLVAAAGNDGECTDCVGYPAAYDTVVAVSATSEDDSLADFSSTGPEVELAAPGEDILSTVPPESSTDGLDTFSGTSMACPHVSGAGGQLMANGDSNTEARDQLHSTAEDIGLGDNEQGNGLVDVAAALGFDSSDDLGDDTSDGDDGTSDGDNPPSASIDSVSENDSNNPHAEFDISWSASDQDGDLDTAELTLTDDTEEETEDSETISISGGSAGGTTQLKAKHDDGSGNDYTANLEVTDSNGNSESDIESFSENGE